MVTLLDNKINLKIEKNLKELLEIINHKSENEAIFASFECETTSKIDDANCLITKYTINFETVLREDKKEN